jgi:hypothetical protein
MVNVDPSPGVLSEVTVPPLCRIGHAHWPLSASRNLLEWAGQNPARLALYYQRSDQQLVTRIANRLRAFENQLATTESRTFHRVGRFRS